MLAAAACDDGSDSSEQMGDTESADSSGTASDGDGGEAGSGADTDGSADASGDDGASDDDDSGASTAGQTGDAAAACEALAEAFASCSGLSPDEFDLELCESNFEGSVDQGCNAAHVGAFIDFATNGGEWECTDSDVFPATDDEAVAIGFWCPVTLLDSLCVGLSCQFDQDCSDGTFCNSATNACVNENAVCAALPCQFDQDCPELATCNTANEICVLE